MMSENEVIQCVAEAFTRPDVQDLLNSLTTNDLHKNNQTLDIIESILLKYDKNEIWSQPVRDKGILLIRNTIPDILKYLEAIPSCLYKSYSNVTNITIPSNIAIIRKEAFFSCVGLTEVNFEANSECIEIGASAFYGCNHLKELVLPKTIKSILSHAFGACDELIEFTIPENVEEIGKELFEYDYNLEKVRIESNIELDIRKDSGLFLDCDKLSLIEYKNPNNTEFLQTVCPNARLKLIK